MSERETTWLGWCLCSAAGSLLAEGIWVAAIALFVAGFIVVNAKARGESV